MAFEPLNLQTHLTKGGAVLHHLLNLSLLFFIKISVSQVDFYHQENKFGRKKKEKMSGRNGGRKVDLKLNLSPPINHRRPEESPRRSVTMSPSSSCVSSENIHDETELRYSSSPEATSMMLVGCPRCLMYVMLAEGYPKCPKCKSTVLLDVLHDNNTKKTRKA